MFEHEEYQNPETLVEDIGREFLEFLKEEKIVSESFVKRTNVLLEIEEANLPVISEALSKTGDGLDVDGQFVSWNEVERVWKDPDHYPTREDVMIAFGVPPQSVYNIKKDTLTRKIGRVREDYNDHSGRDSISNFANRKKKYGKAQEEQSEQQEPSRENIHPGKRNRNDRTTRTMDKVNDAEILSGQFYADYTKIPRQRWAGWLRFWDRRKTSVNPNKKGLLGGEWNKYFLMGYQLERDLLFEIWYNTMDSSFNIHDKNGAELGRPVATLQEAMKYFVRQIISYSEDDADVFKTGGVTNQVATSMMRGIAQELSKDSSEAERQAKLDRLEKARMGQEQRYYKQARKEEAQKSAAKMQKKEDRRKAMKEAIQKSKEVASGLGSSAYASMKDSASTVSDKLSVGLKAAFEEAKEKASDEKELISILYNKVKENVKDTIESDAEIAIMVNEYVRDPEIREQIKKQFRKEWEDEEEKRREDIRNRLRDAESKYKDAIDKKNEDNAEKQRKEREKAEKRGKKSLGNKFDLLSKRNNRAAQSDEKNDKKRGDVVQMDRERANRAAKDIEQQQMDLFNVNESEEVVEEDFDMTQVSDADFEAANDAFEKAVDSPKIKQQVESIRQMANASPYTQAALASTAIESLLDTYTETRAKKTFGGRFGRFIKKTWLGEKRGRVMKIVEPTEPAPFFDELRQSLTGKRARADFVIGYTLSDRVNIEIWYETVPNPDFLKGRSNNPMISSFSVYDISSRSVVRKNIPYYRQAVQIVLGKIGLTQ